MVAIERRVERLEFVDRARAVRTQHDAIRPHAVLDRIALLEEFRIRRDVEHDPDAPAVELGLDRVAHAVGGADRHGRLVDDDRRSLEILADRSRHREHVAQVGAAILIRWRADGDEDQVAVGYGTRCIGREIEPAGAVIGQHHILEPGLVDRDHALLEAAHLGLVDIDAEHVIADLGKAGAGDQTDVSGAEDRYFHGCPCRSLVSRES